MFNLEIRMLLYNTFPHVHMIDILLFFGRGGVKKPPGGSKYPTNISDVEYLIPRGHEGGRGAMQCYMLRNTA